MNVSTASPFASIQYHHPCEWGMELPALALPAMFAASMERAPNAPLAHFMGRTFSYRELYEDARRFASALMQNGIAPGDRVGLFLPNVPIYIAAYYGAMMAGAVVVNFSPLYSVDELAHQVKDSGTRMLVTVDVPELYGTAQRVLHGSVLETLVVGRLSAILPTVKGFAMKLFARAKIAKVAYGAGPGGTVREWSAMLDAADTSVGNEFPAIKTDDLALLQYTGGTTGAPKGAMLTHANLSINAQQVAAINPYGDAANEVFMAALPLFHVFANTALLNHAVVSGASLAMVPRFDGAQVLDTLQKHRATGFPGVPTMFQALLDNPKKAKTDFSSLRVCISGGAALAAPVRERFEKEAGVRLVEGYGLTESSGVVSVNPYAGTRKPGTIGQVVAGTRIRFVDKEDAGKPAPEGEPGELVVHGPQIMRGYWNRPDTDADTFVEIDGLRWLRTGDIAVQDEDGFLQIVDRSKDMIAVGGFKVFPSQVENVLLQHDAVKEVLVMGMDDEYLGETPHAYVVRNDGATTGEDALTEWVNTRVGKHERVKNLVFRNDLPKTMIGKLDRKALRAEIGR
ncbi:MAG: long-chain fatty acid--CoA ligase [Pontixanthobacter sp.]